ncbi:MAG: GFA family protein [Pseudomonadota bacterium]
MADAVTGQCLCGAVRISGTVEERAIQACHCGQCRRWTGGGPLTSVRVHDLKVEGEDAIRTFHVSEWGERAFCGTCGTTLYWSMRDRQPAYVTVGLLDDQSDYAVTHEIFIDARPEWFPPWAGATQSTEAEEMAKLHAFLKGENS